VVIMINARHSNCNVEADCLCTCIYIYVLFIQSASIFQAIVYSGLFYGTNEQW
jgi:hypothetical protein